MMTGRGRMRGRKSVAPRASVILKAESAEDTKLTKDQVVCPICYSIFLDPVTFPCGHSVCRPCFDVHIWETSIYCPCCRYRLSIWARKAVKANEIVNVKLKKQIELQFPAEVAAQRRLQKQSQGPTGEALENSGDSRDEADEANSILASFLAEVDSAPAALDGEIAEPGTIAKEFETIYSQQRQELLKEELEAELASQQFIRENVSEEEIQMLSQLEQDSQLALELQKAEEEENARLLRSRVSPTAASTSPNPAAITIPKSSLPVLKPHNSYFPITPTGSLKRRKTLPLQSSKKLKRNPGRLFPSKTPPAKGIQMKIGHFFGKSPKNSPSSSERINSQDQQQFHEVSLFDDSQGSSGSLYSQRQQSLEASLRDDSQVIPDSDVSMSDGGFFFESAEEPAPAVAEVEPLTLKPPALLSDSFTTLSQDDSADIEDILLKRPTTSAAEALSRDNINVKVEALTLQSELPSVQARKTEPSLNLHIATKLEPDSPQKLETKDCDEVSSKTERPVLSIRRDIFDDNPICNEDGTSENMPGSPDPTGESGPNNLLASARSPETVNSPVIPKEEPVAPSSDHNYSQSEALNAPPAAEFDHNYCRLVEPEGWKELQERLRQEEEDREFALQLQRLYDNSKSPRGRHNGRDSEKYSIRTWLSRASMPA